MFGIIGLVGNVASMLVLSSGQAANVNTRAAFLEVVNDFLGSAALIVTAIVIATPAGSRRTRSQDCSSGR